MVAMETIAVTRGQSKKLHDAARQRASRFKKRGSRSMKASDYIQRVAGTVPPLTDNGTSCTGHILVRVVIGLRKSAGITHRSMGRVHFKSMSPLTVKHPRGVACYMMPPTPVMAIRSSQRPRRQTPELIPGEQAPEPVLARQVRPTFDERYDMVITLSELRDANGAYWQFLRQLARSRSDAYLDIGEDAERTLSEHEGFHRHLTTAIKNLIEDTPMDLRRAYARLTVQGPMYRKIMQFRINHTAVAA
jgi:hypothetical protein